MPEKGEVITVKGEVVSVKPKFDRYDPDCQGIMVKPRGGEPFWFRWTPDRGKLSRGDVISLHGTVSGIGDDKGRGKTTFLRGVKVEGKTCTHLVIVREGKNYNCDSCGVGAVVQMKKKAGEK